MWKWLRRKQTVRNRPPADEALKGAPLRARLKTYSAETGFVYQYVYRGYRPMTEARGTEHVFEANRDRKQSFRVTVHLLDVEIGRCVRSVGRELIGAEQYALVKMSLFSAFNELTDIAQFSAPLVPGAAEMEGYLRALGRV
jgi:hypothetical protein